MTCMNENHKDLSHLMYANHTQTHTSPDTDTETDRQTDSDRDTHAHAKPDKYKITDRGYLT